MPGNWHVRFGGGPYGKGPANCGHLAVRPTQPSAERRVRPYRAQIVQVGAGPDGRCAKGCGRGRCGRWRRSGGVSTGRPSADSRSSTCPHARRRCSGLPGSPSPAAARKRSGRSGPTPNSTRCSARLIADGDVPTASDRRRPAALEQDLPWRRSDYAGLRIDLGLDRRAALLRTA